MKQNQTSQDYQTKTNEKEIQSITAAQIDMITKEANR